MKVRVLDGAGRAARAETRHIFGTRLVADLAEVHPRAQRQPDISSIRALSAASPFERLGVIHRRACRDRPLARIRTTGHPVVDAGHLEDLRCGSRCAPGRKQRAATRIRPTVPRKSIGFYRCRTSPGHHRYGRHPHIPPSHGASGHGATAMLPVVCSMWDAHPAWIPPAMAHQTVLDRPGTDACEGDVCRSSGSHSLALCRPRPERKNKEIVDVRVRALGGGR